MAFCFAIINSAAAITLKIINDARAEFFGKHILKFTILEGDLKMTFNLHYVKVLSIAFCSRFWISNDFLSRNGKRKPVIFFGTIQILGHFINTLCKYIFMQ